MDHILFIPLSVELLLTVVSDAAMNMGAKYLFEFLLSIPLGVYPEVELLDHMVVLCLAFEELSNCFPWWLHYFTFSSAMSKCLNFSTSLPTFVTFVFLKEYVTYNSHSSGCEVISDCGLDLLFPNDWWFDHLFMCLLVIWVYTLKKYLCKPSAHFYIEWFFFFGYWIVGILYIFWILIAYLIYDVKISPPILFFLCLFVWLHWVFVAVSEIFSRGMRLLVEACGI